MKKYCLFLLLFVFVLSGCSSITTEEVDSLVSESYEKGKDNGYDNGYEEGFYEGTKAFMENPGYYAPSDWYCVPVDMEEEYKDKLDYYSWLCEYYGLPEYSSSEWDEFIFVHYVLPQEDDLPRKFYSENLPYYHSFYECPEIYTSPGVHLISKNEAIDLGYQPCPRCENENEQNLEYPESSQEEIVYWTPNGSRYHSTENCRTLNKSKVINSGTIDEAIASGHNEPCSVCY